MKFFGVLILSISLSQLADAATVITGLGVIAVFQQIWQARHDAQVALITGMTTMMLEVDKAFIDYPEMRQYFSGGKQLPADETEAERARAIAMAMANSLDHVVEHLRFMKNGAQEAWGSYIHNLHKTSPVFKQLLADHGDWWPGLQKQIANNS